MGIVTEDTKRRVAELRRRQANKFRDVADLMHDRKVRQLHRIGKLGARFLDSIMPRPTLEGWGYDVDEKELTVTFQHTRWNTPVTQSGKTKTDRATGEPVTVQNVIHWLDAGTPGHEPAVSPVMQYVGKYEWAGTGNAFSRGDSVWQDGTLVWRTNFVEGIEPHNFFKQLRAYLRGRGEYKIDFDQVVSAELNALISGTRRRGFIH